MSESSLHPCIGIATVLAQYSDGAARENKAIYEQLEIDFSVDSESTLRKPVGRSGQVHNLFHRQVRWHQQTLRHLGILESAGRGQWRLSEKAKNDITPAPRKSVMVAFSTDLGCALWANAQDVFSGLQENITLAFSSPPYPLARARAYGNVSEQQYVDWLCEMMEPIVKSLRPGGNVVLNLSNDIFESKLPSRSLYLERLTLALQDRFGLHLMDRFVWHNPSKAPGPLQWASIKRVQTNVGYEPVLWFTNDPANVIADNRRVLQPHSERHLKLMAAGGESRTAEFSGGAYKIKPGSFGNETAGKIPRNILTIAHRDSDQDPSRNYAKERGWPAHPAPMPLKLAEFFVQFLSELGDLVVDPFGGMATTGKAAENHGRRWLITEKCREYIESASERFRKSKGFAFGA